MFKWLQKLFGAGSKGACSCGCAGEGVDKVRELEHFVDYVVRALVDYPDEVNVSSRAAENGTVIRIDCRKEDIGKVVGKRGKTIMAIRSLVSGAGGRLQQRISVEVAD
jgi:predicted RNA-binding protein YlqC (UPF0109 family)